MGRGNSSPKFQVAFLAGMESADSPTVAMNLLRELDRRNRFGIGDPHRDDCHSGEKTKPRWDLKSDIGRPCGRRSTDYAA